MNYDILAGGREIACLFLSAFLLSLLKVERCSVDEKKCLHNKYIIYAFIIYICLNSNNLYFGRRS